MKDPAHSATKRNVSARTSALVVLLLFLDALAFAAESYKSDLPGLGKKPYHVGGYFDHKPVLYGLDYHTAIGKRFFVGAFEEVLL
jgi:hypothetical protein